MDFVFAFLLFLIFVAVALVGARIEQLRYLLREIYIMERRED